LRHRCGLTSRNCPMSVSLNSLGSPGVESAEVGVKSPKLRDFADMSLLTVSPCLSGGSEVVPAVYDRQHLTSNSRSADMSRASPLNFGRAPAPRSRCVSLSLTQRSSSPTPSLPETVWSHGAPCEDADGLDVLARRAVSHASSRSHSVCSLWSPDMSHRRASMAFSDASLVPSPRVIDPRTSRLAFRDANAVVAAFPASRAEDTQSVPSSRSSSASTASAFRSPRGETGWVAPTVVGGV